jgi:hypothetical protein
MDERPIMLDGRALAEKQVLPTIWGRLYCQDPQGLRGGHDTCFLQHLPCPCLLPSLAKHLVSARKRQLTLTLTREGASDHQQTASEGYQYDDYGGGVFVAGHHGSLLLHHLSQ